MNGKKSVRSTIFHHQMFEIENMNNTSFNLPFFFYLQPQAFWPEYYDFKHLSFRIKDKMNKVSQQFPLENPSHFVIRAEGVKTESRTTTSESEADEFYTVLISGGSINPVTLIIRKYQYGDAVAK
jgi:hypothetical protein